MKIWNILTKNFLKSRLDSESNVTKLDFLMKHTNHNQSCYLLDVFFYIYLKNIVFLKYWKSLTKVITINFCLENDYLY